MTHPTFTRAEAAGWIRAAGRALGVERAGMSWSQSVHEDGEDAVRVSLTRPPASSAWRTVGHQRLCIFVRRLCRHIRD